jgi:hypothetical protein
LIFPHENKGSNLMKTLRIVIERSADMSSAYAENAEGIYGGGDTVEEAKQSILGASIVLFFRSFFYFYRSVLI